MANGDTKTEAMLNVLGNGGSGDEFRGCCNTKTQSYILDAIDRINALQPGGSSDFNDLSNRPQLNGTQMTGNTNITNFVGTDGTAAGAQGLVPAPAAADADKFLKSDGTWATAGGGSGPTVVQTTGQSTTDVMSQKAVTDTIFFGNDPKKIIITKFDNNQTPGQYSVALNGTIANNATYSFSACGGRAYSSHTFNAGLYAVSSGQHGVSIGMQAQAGDNCISIGQNANTQNRYGSIALGYGAVASSDGEVNIGSSINTSYGYNNSNYRLISGVYDGQNAHDAVTLGQLNALITELQALGLNVSLQGAAGNAGQNSGSSEDPGTMEPDPGTVEQTVTCPFCGSLTPADSTVCQICGNDISGGTIPDPDPVEEPIAPEEPTEEPVEG